ncbi:MAG: hypothetical protein JSW61_04595 [Candidatus Thorarchaeota archaeon]|nr:MAG: hypothetical protein JSW61_04595 [Candidatus Thorarchaeota archaeon]
MAAMERENQNQIQDDTIVEATIEQLRKGVEKVLVHYTERIEGRSREEKEPGSEILIGDTIIFEEEIDFSPAQIVAIKVWNDVWFLISTSEHPPGGYPTTKDAVKAGQAEEKKLRVLVDYLTGNLAKELREDARDWKPDMRGEAKEILKMVKNGRERWEH